jgi:hypothetical protein
MGDGMLVCPQSAVGTFGGVMSPAPVEPFCDFVVDTIVDFGTIHSCWTDFGGFIKKATVQT